VKNRMREICTSGTVRGGDGDIPTYSASVSHACQYPKSSLKFYR
jgi:hypothetical protein